MDAYVQKRVQGKYNKLTADLGLNEVGCFVEHVEDAHANFLADSAYYGNVAWITAQMRRMQYEHNQLGYVPDRLMNWAGRKIEKMPLDKAIHTIDKYIKPLNTRQKAFACFKTVASDKGSMINLIETANCDYNEEVLVSDAVDIVSEWRCYIHEGEIRGAFNYKGNLRVHPNYNDIDVMIKDFTTTDSPIAYALDVYINTHGETLVMEVNDVMSLGWYGLTPVYAGRMIVDRWEQIHKNKKS